MDFSLIAAALTDANRPIRLRLWGAAGESAHGLLVKQVSGSETIDGGIDYTLLCVARRSGLALKDFIANPAELQFVTDSGALRCVCGLVAEAAEGQGDGGLATYHLRLRDAFSLLDKTCNTRVFLHASEVDITRTLLGEWRRANSVAALAFEFDLSGLKLYPARTFTLQYNESTAAFLRRLWKRRGLSWFIRAGSNNAGVPIHILVLFDDSFKLRRNGAGAIRYHRDGATETSDTIIAWHAVRTLSAGAAVRSSWNFVEHWLDENEDTNTNNQGTMGNCFAGSLRDYQVDVPHAGDSMDDYRQLGLARIRRHEYEAKLFHGVGSHRAMCVGEWNAISGHPELDRHNPNEREFIITALHIEAENNLPKPVDELVRRLFCRNGWQAGDGLLAQASAERGMRYTNRFSCVRRGIPIVPAYDPRIDLPRTEMQWVLVVGPANDEVHCDRLGRVKIRFPGCRPDDHAHAEGAGASGTERDSAWVQVATPWAGSQYGSISLPRVGNQVLCAFIGGDPDKPLIIGRAHGGRNSPTSFDRQSSLPGDRYLSGIVSKEIKAKRYNQLRLDDTPGEISAQLASAHGSSQLNLGYLTHPRKNGRAEARGQGFELATNDSGAIRTAKALLISTWKRLDACGDQLGREEHLALMQDCLDLFKSLGEYAAQHHGLAVDPSSQAALKTDLEAKDGAKPTLSVTAPEGLAFSTAKTMVSYAGVNLDTVAQQHLQLTSGQRFSVNAGKGVSLFSHADGIVQVAHKGKFLMQSQHDDMQVDAAKDLKTTAGQRMIFMADKEITFIVAGGAYLTLKGGAVEIGGPGAITIKTDGHHWGGPASAKAELPTFGEGDFGRTPRLLRATDGEPVEGVDVHVARPDGSAIDGKTNAAGESAPISADQMEQLKVIFHTTKG